MTPREEEEAIRDLAIVVRSLVCTVGLGNTSSHVQSEVEVAYHAVLKLSEDSLHSVAPLLDDDPKPMTEWGNRAPAGDILRYSERAAREQSHQNGWPLLMRSVTYSKWRVVDVAK